MLVDKYERLCKKLAQQVKFIERSAIAFDEGWEDESLRIATSLRILFHDTHMSTSLVEHLKLADQKMLSSARGWNDHRDFISWVLDLNSPTPVTTRPILGDQFNEISIHNWWEKEDVFVYDHQKYTRKKIILIAANKDGGAHVEQELSKFYEALGKGENGFTIDGSGLEYNGPPPFDLNAKQSATNAHVSLIRQFAHELLAAYRHFDWQRGIELTLSKMRVSAKSTSANREGRG